MKISKQNPRHWSYLVKSGIYILISIPIRLIARSSQQKRVVLYGHKYNGNLKAFGDYCLEHSNYQMYYATIDPNYYQKLQSNDEKITPLSLLKFRDILTIARSDAIIGDRGTHTLVLYLWLTNISFIDVWHGIQIFKKFSAKDMSMLRKYKQIWVSSPAIKDIYVNDYGLSDSQVKITGYGRVDRLVNKDYSIKDIREKYGIEDKFKKIILLAPTWQQDDSSRQIIPFDEAPTTFLSRLNDLAAANDALVIFRVHMNTNSQNRVQLQSMDNIRLMPSEDYPQTEEFLAITDLLIADWSSIVFDYLPLQRPVVFIDTKAPFKNGLTFDETYRYSDIA
ncbi:MAG: CDP-glycerol glycerophosphotransferase family protein, partial [Candidatus Saccharimonadales bacterium]